ncbi:MAG: penicillin-binding protein 2 [Acidobacteriota bacterium]
MSDYRTRKDYRDYYQEIQLGRRIRIVWSAFAVVFVVYAAHFWLLQIVRSAEYRELADNNRMRSVPVQPLRGMIYDRFGRLMVENRVSFNVLLNQDQLIQEEMLLSTWARSLEMDRAVLKARLGSRGRRRAFEPILLKEDVDLAEVAYLEARPEEFDRFTIEVEAKRRYPLGTVAAHLLGYLGEVSEVELERHAEAGVGLGDLVGKAGVERIFDTLLRGRKGLRRVLVNSRGRLIGEVGLDEEPVPGSDLTMSVNLDMQRELALAFGEEVGAAVFLDARSGEVLAIDSRPGYDPNEFSTHFSRERWVALTEDPRHPLQNRAVQSKYSPGSTFKVVLALAALQEKVITPKTTFHCAGSVVIYGRRFSCHKAGGHGRVNLHKALVKSCNVYFYQVGKELGIENIAKYARLLGLGTRTGIDLPQEEAGLVPDTAWKKRVTGERWYPGETISVAIGQGALQITPVQMAHMMLRFATGKVPSPPRVQLQELTGSETGEQRSMAVEKKNLELIRAGLRDAVNNGGTGWRARMPDVEVCGKTGTAQVVAKSAGVDSSKLKKSIRDHSWFAGWAPCAEPEVAFAVFVEHGGHGGESAAPIARRVLETYFNDEEAPRDVQLVQSQGSTAP